MTLLSTAGAALAASWVSTLGCHSVLGIDEYRTRDPEQPGQNRPIVNPCAANEVVTAGGACAPVGVAADTCNEHGFSATSGEHAGACTAVLPEGDCGLLGLPIGRTTCPTPDNRCADPDHFPGVANFEGTILYVNADATDGGDGATKESAFKTLTDPYVRFARTEWGRYTIIDFSDCTPEAG